MDQDFNQNDYQLLWSEKKAHWLYKHVKVGFLSNYFRKPLLVLGPRKKNKNKNIIALLFPCEMQSRVQCIKWLIEKANLIWILKRTIVVIHEAYIISRSFNTSKQLVKTKNFSNTGSKDLITAFRSICLHLSLLKG